MGLKGEKGDLGVPGGLFLDLREKWDKKMG